MSSENTIQSSSPNATNSNNRIDYSSSFLSSFRRYDSATTATVTNITAPATTTPGTTTTETTTTAPVTPPTINLSEMNGVDRETKILLRETLELISNQVERYTALKERENTQEIRDKLIFWQRAKTQELKIQNRLMSHGVVDDLQSHFKNMYERRSSMLVEEFQQPLDRENNPRFYERLNVIDSELTQVATGSSREQLRANREVTALLARKVRENAVEENRLTVTIKRLEATVSRTTNAEAKAQLRERLRELREQREVINDKQRAFYTASFRFGARAKNFTDLDRIQYSQFVNDVEHTDGDISVNFLP